MPVMRNVLLTVTYDGADFQGWQYQGPHKRTVQGTLEAAIEEVTGACTRICGSSRTDSGVHALGQAVNFYTETSLSNHSLRRALNAILPFDLSILEARDAPMNLHVTRDSVRKRYRYLIQDGRIRDPIGRHYAWFARHHLSVAAMQASTKYLLGEHDFKAFQTSGSSRESSVRTIYDLTVERLPTDHGERVVIEVEANGFLYNMVRNIAGSLFMVGRETRDPEWLREVLLSGDRRRAGMAAPAHGLFLLWVKFPGDEDIP
jgi:tRNA pseudouridine38-40 synthase